MKGNPSFWSEYLQLHRRTVLAVAVLDLALWAFGQAYATRFLIWDPSIVVEHFLFKWPPLAISGLYLVLLYVLGFLASVMRVPAKLAWGTTAGIGALIVGVMYAAMYESTSWVS